MVSSKSLARQDPLRSLQENLAIHVEDYHQHFQTATSDSLELSEAYTGSVNKLKYSLSNDDAITTPIERLRVGSIDRFFGDSQRFGSPKRPRRPENLPLVDYAAMRQILTLPLAVAVWLLLSISPALADRWRAATAGDR